MRIFKFTTLICLSMAIVFTGCIKDKGFEDHKYGIQITEHPAVSFPQATSSPVALSLNSTTTSQTVSTDLSVESANAPTSDINVTLVADTTGFFALGLTQIPAASYSVSLTPTISAGKKLSTVVITFPNTTLLNPTLKYGIALTITSVSSGYQVASNLKRVILSFSIKNMYDGVYSVISGTVQRYTAPGTVESPSPLSGSLAGNPDVSLITTGPNSVGIPAPANPNPGALYWAFGNNSQVAGIDNVRISVDPVTNLVTTSALGNATLANWGTMINKYDPASKTFTLNFAWNPTANRREYSVVLRYKKPR